MSTMMDKYKQNEILKLQNQHNDTLKNLNIHLLRNIQFIKSLRIGNKLPFIRRLIQNYNNRLRNLENLLNQNILDVNSYTNDFPITFNNKKALLIGINYIGTNHELNGCIDDVERMKSFLETKGFNNFDIMTDLTDIKPTRFNILDKIKNLVDASVEGDLLFIYFSGHGSYTYDFNGDEKDGKDELIISSDLKYIVDDEIKDILNKFSKKNVSIIGMFDSCHSGTMMDLRYHYDYLKNNYSENVMNKKCLSNVLMIGGCMDDQTSLEAIIDGTPQGALTSTFMDVMNSKNNLSWKELMYDMHESLKSRHFPQIPQISTNIFFNIDGKVF
jgi:hypothetical protein